MTRTPVLSQDAPQPSGGYSQGIVAGGFLYLAGQGPFDASGNRAGATIAEHVLVGFDVEGDAVVWLGD
jgi:enamine deaminase RidA (YjgF/YER057c/UK114 family)